MEVFHMKKKFYISKLLQLILIVYILFATCFLTFLCVLLILNPEETLLKKICGTLFVGISIIPTYVASVSILTYHIEVSSEGVAYYGAGFRMYTPWNNIVGITQIQQPSFPFHIMTVFVFRQAALLNVSFEEGKRQRQAVVENYRIIKLFISTPMNYLWYLPLSRNLISPFELEQGEFSVYIRQYAPFIVEAMKPV